MVGLGLGIPHPSFESIGFLAVAGFYKTTDHLWKILRPFWDTSLRTSCHEAALLIWWWFSPSVDQELLELATFVFYFQTLLGKYILVLDYKKYFWLLVHIGKWTWFETRAKGLECWLVIYSSASCHVKRIYNMKKVIFLTLEIFFNWNQPNF